MFVKLLGILIIFQMNFRICQSKNYENYSLYSVLPEEIDQLKFLQHLEQTKYVDIIFWTKPVKMFHDVQFIVSPVDKNLLLERAKHFKIKLNLMIPNIQKAFDEQRIRKYLSLRVDTYSWNYYHTLEDIYQWLNDLSKKYSDVAKLIHIGNTTEGREILALAIMNGHDKKQVLIEGGIHGSEWISTEFVTYVADQLIHNNGTHRNLAAIARNYNWYLIPILNPDGYEYNQKFDRLYKNNRSNYSLTSTHGVDLNRNFGYSFRRFATSIHPDDENYGGPYAFSEPETKAIRTFIGHHLHHLKVYVSIHSYGQKIVIPYSDRINHVDDYAEMANYGKQAIVKMYKLYGRKYKVGTFYDTTGIRISGNSASWVKKNYQVSRVFTLLMRDNGTFGYALPNDQILPACREAMVGLLEIMTTKPKYLRADPFSASSRGTASLEILMFFYIVILMLR